MSSPEEKLKHSKRLKRKQREKVRSNIAKDLRSSKYRMRIVEDKHGNRYDLRKLSHRELVEAIQEKEVENDSND